MSNPTESVDAAVLRGWGLPDPGQSKQSRGDGVIVGASRRTPGAVILAFEAVMRVGAGRVAVLVPGSVEPQLGAHVPEAAVHPLPDAPDDAITGAGAAAVSDADAVLLGPGFDDVPQTRATLHAVLALRPRSLVLDAYALAVLPDIARDLMPAALVLTPNREELDMLDGHRSDGAGGEDADDEPFAAVAARVARRYDAVVAGYGIAAAPSGRVFEVAGAGPELATAGSGDVLAGAVTGFLARGVDPHRAAAWGLWAHARAGARLARVHGLGLLARELATELAAAVHELDDDEPDEPEDHGPER